jgi:hypothetical protein
MYVRRVIAVLATALFVLVEFGRIPQRSLEIDAQVVFERVAKQIGDSK